MPGAALWAWGSRGGTEPRRRQPAQGDVGHYQPDRSILSGDQPFVDAVQKAAYFRWLELACREF